MAELPPLSLFPIEIATIGFGLFRLIKSDIMYEKIIGLLVTLLHVKRFYEHKEKIINTSLNEWKYSLLLTFGLVFVLYNILRMKKSILLFSIIAGLIQIFGYIIASRYIKFNWFSFYDIPILLSSLFIGYSLLKKNDYWASVWFSDAIYHLWELLL